MDLKKGDIITYLRGGLEPRYGQVEFVKGYSRVYCKWGKSGLKDLLSGVYDYNGDIKTISIYNRTLERVTDTVTVSEEDLWE